MSAEEPSEGTLPAARGEEDHRQEMFLQFLENQKSEIAIRQDELALKKQESQNNHEWATASLAAQERDRQNDRVCARDRQRDRYILIGVLSVCLMLLLGAALAFDKDAIAMEIVKAIAFLGTGAFGGYYAGKAKGASSPDGQEEQ